MSILRLVIFATGTIALVWFSRVSLRNPRVHGFYRFFAFESLLALILLNLPYWFKEPLSFLQIVSWFLLAISLYMAVAGWYLLVVSGKPSGNLEQTTSLVQRSVYKHIRHPLYASFVWLGWGVYLKAPSLTAAILTLVATVAAIVTARVEEVENISKFGDDYQAYMQSSKMFIPFIY